MMYSVAVIPCLLKFVLYHFATYRLLSIADPILLFCDVSNYIFLCIFIPYTINDVFYGSIFIFDLIRNRLFNPIITYKNSENNILSLFFSKRSNKPDESAKKNELSTILKKCFYRGQIRFLPACGYEKRIPNILICLIVHIHQRTKKGSEKYSYILFQSSGSHYIMDAGITCSTLLEMKADPTFTVLKPDTFTTLI